MKILFIGTVQFSFDALECILQEDGNVVAVITQDKAGLNSDFKKIEPICKKKQYSLFENRQYKLKRSSKLG